MTMNQTSNQPPHPEPVQEPKRQAHASLEMHSRRLKALKIERLLNLAARPQPIRLLEVGCGAGGIAHYFGTHTQLDCRVSAVDVNDNRQVFDGYDYQSVAGVDLPFADNEFDVVITNHVIEHVGDAAAQVRHLREIRRVLRPDGAGYLAVPNRWMITEPHFKLKFLSWWPKSWRTPYLRMMGKGDFYDCEPLEMHELEDMLRQSGLAFRNICIEGVRATFEIEHPGKLPERVLRRVPDALLRPLRPIIPTLIYRIEKNAA